MSKGLGKLQRHILLHIINMKKAISKSELYTNVIHEYWNEEIGDMFNHPLLCTFIYSSEDQKELKKRRACISQSLRRLNDNGYIHIAPWGITLTEKGINAIMITNQQNKQ